MKLKPLLLLGGLATAAYKAYQNRDRLAQTFDLAKEGVETGKEALDDVQGQVQNLSNQTSKLQAAGKDLDYKFRVYEQESKPHIEAITAILNKYNKQK